MEEIIYRKSNKDDLPQILEMMIAFDLNASNMVADGFLVAAQGRRVLGCARITEIGDGNIELSSVAVVEGFRKKGIGGKLIQMLLAQEKRRPIYLMCRRRNQKFYEEQGFKEMQDDLLPALYRDMVEKIISKGRAINNDGFAMIKE
ncbi:MAG: GNAT family N-acetyltransferase [Candidatus Nealsonbacteria bacterium DGGOD1a]|jgi:N-acetylglutamate synthase-like GNAT family acetyltransferase|nr:MAG: GNAT family N-acetyltransferase [Candidatus Nealsonbacteria bacterium DGGOD1a]